MADSKETNNNATEGENQNNDKGSNPPGGGSGDGEHSLPTEEIRTIVREEIANALGNKGDNKDDKDSKDDDDKHTRTMPRRQDIEAMAERMVREQAEKLHHEQEHERLRNGNGTPPKQEQQEAAPKKVRRITKALWGSDD